MLKEIFAISNYPFLQQDGDFSTKLLRIVKTYGALFLMMMAVGPILLLADKLVTDVLHHKSFNLQNKQLFQQLFKKLGFVSSYIFICVVGPVFEELIFRFPLSFTRRSVVISALIALFYFSGSVYHPQGLMLKVGLEIIIAAVIFILCGLYIPDTPLNLTPPQKRGYIILSICLFGMMHILNYRPVALNLIWLYPVFVIPQLLMGWAMTYIRFKNGFIWGIALHCLINTLSTLISFHR